MAEKLTLLEAEQAQNTLGEWEKIVREAIDACTKIKKDREKEILFDRFGLGKKPRTLNSIGVKHGVTRERIRQIINNAIRKVQKYSTSKELEAKINKVEEFVASQGGFATKREIIKKFAQNEMEGNAVNFVANLSKELEYLKDSAILRSGWNNKSIKQSEIKEIAKKAVSLLKQSGKPVSKAKLVQEVGKDEAKVIAAISASKEIMKTDTGFYGLTVWPSVNPKSIRDKSKYILERHGEPIHYSRLTEKISEMGDKTVTRQSVHNELIKNGDFVLVGRGIYALTEWGYKPGVVEEVIYEVLVEASEPLHKNIIIEKVLERRMVKESTIVLNLQKNRFKRVGKGTYTIN